MLDFGSIEELERLWAGARETGIEGLMLKRRDSPYLAGRPKGHWYKWKRAPLTLDAVLMYAQRGSGKRSSYYSDYTFGAWREGEAGEPELVPVGKSYFGFTDEELRQLDAFVRNHTVDSFGPVRQVEPKLVFEVAFELGAPLEPAQIRRRHALSPHPPHPLGQACRGGRPARDTDGDDRGVDAPKPQTNKASRLVEVAIDVQSIEASEPCGIRAWHQSFAFLRFRMRIYCQAGTVWLGGQMPRIKRFLIILIKPSHYDDDGYVIQWFRSPIPSNSLASVYSLIDDSRRRKVLGDDVDIEIDVIDETNTVLRFNKLIRRLKAADGAMVGLVGVQSNQFPRAVDIGRQFRDAGIQVIMGGFHAAGSIAMLPQCPPEIVSAQELGISIYAGEAEGRMDEIVQAAWAGTLKPLYNLMKDLPDLSNATLPILPAKVVRKMAGAYTSFDAGRGCPFQCSFCTIINVQGRKSRHRTPDDVEAIIRTNAAQNINRFFITDDDFARNKDWEGILDRLIWLREEQGFKFKVTLQVDTLCHRLDGFIEKAARGGCARVFIGLENIDPDALAAAKKRQNKIWEYRKMLQAWKDVGVITYAGYILGFPDDTPEKIARNIEIIQREMPLDLIEFFFLTPLPGSEDHKVLHTKGVWMDPDLNKYDLNHRVSHHPIMSDATWEKVYFNSWRQFYTPEHVETVLRRDAARGKRTSALYSSVVHFLGSILIEKVHPLECGIVRRKIRTQRRPGMKIENPILFYPRRVVESLTSGVRWAQLFLRFRPALKRVKEDKNAKAYTDLAMSASSDEELDGMDLIQVFKDAIPRTHGAPGYAGKRELRPALP